MPIIFKAVGGRDPEKVVVELIENALPTQGDLVSAAAQQRTRILKRTEAGLDVNGSPFPPYSTTGPIYIDIGRKGAQRTTKQKISAVQRLAKKVGRPAKVFKPNRIDKARKRVARLGQKRERKPARLRKIAGVTPIGGITPGGLLKAASYAWFKIGFLGRRGVDLLGHRAPHMLHALVMRFAGGQRSGAVRVPLNAMKQLPGEVQLGFYGAEARIAIAHNQGRGSLPRRRFFGFGQGDTKFLADHIMGRIRQRLRRSRAA